MKRKFLILLTTCILISVSILGCSSIKIQTAKDTRGTNVKVGYMPNYGSLWSILNAIELGYMRDANILVELIEFRDGPSIINALENGDIDIGYIGQGAHKNCINGYTKIFALSHISNADAIIAVPGINSMQDLRGKMVTYVEGTSSEVILNMALKKENMNMYDIIGVKALPEDIVLSIKDSGVSAAAIWSPYSLEILDEIEGSKKLVDNFTFSDETIGLSSWVTSEKFIELNHGLLVRFTKALFKAMDYAANDHYEETSTLIANQIASNQENIFKQRGDAKWLTGREIVSGIEDGTIRDYYELQKKGFMETDMIYSDKNVEDYVMFDIMLEAGDY